MEKVHILGIAGSLRKKSINRAMLNYMAEMAHDGADIEIFDLKDLPLYDGDVESEGDPASVVAWKSAIKKTDALLIVTPEYNSGLPAVTKNAIDWASRPFDGEKQVLNEKAVAMTGASPGRVGTMRSQLHLRDVLLNTNSRVLKHPQVYVGGAMKMIGEDGNFDNEATGVYLKKLVAALAVLAKQ